MKSVALAFGLILAVTSAAEAKTAVAICNDGQNLQVNMALNGAYVMYLKTSLGTYQVGVLEPGYTATNSAWCGAPAGTGGANASIQICLLPTTIEILSGHDATHQGVRSVVCKANVTFH